MEALVNGVRSCLPGGHDPLYVLSAVFVCAVGSALTASLYQKVTAEKAASRRLTLGLLTGMTAGSTIWTTHFVAMLGVDFGFSHSYDIKTTVLSLFLAILISSAGFLAVALGRDLASRLAGGTLTGFGIGAMHYVGLSALRFEGFRGYDQTLIAVSLVTGAVLSASAFAAPGRIVPRFPRSSFALFFVLAIASLHYIGIVSLSVEPLGDAVSAADLAQKQGMFVAVLFMTGMIMALGAAASFLDTQYSNERLRDMEHRAYHDPLTRLPNRSLLDERLSASLKGASVLSPVAVVSFDLNRFKDINDVHGHETGDSLLREIARRLEAALGEGEFVSRVGGDEFVAIKTGVRDPEAAAGFARRLRLAVVRDVDVDGKRIAVGSSMGVSMSPADGTAAKELLTKADLAMYRAKRDGMETPMFYDRELDEENRNRSAIAIDLRTALRDNQLELAYQRQNDVLTGEVVGYEALVRWCHPERGFIPPSVFIPIAERDGLINEIGEWVFMTACEQAARWPVKAKVAVNVSPRQLANDNLPDVVKNALERSGLPASMLEIEITESGIVADVDRARAIILELKALGVSLALDDFGTGYSSLSTLQSFPFDKIKIDKSFVTDVANSEQAQAIVKSTISLGRSLRIAVLAEGVETPDDLDFLKEEGCLQVQGFLFGRPIPSRQMAA